MTSESFDRDGRICTSSNETQAPAGMKMVFRRTQVLRKRAVRLRPLREEDDRVLDPQVRPLSR